MLRLFISVVSSCLMLDSILGFGVGRSNIFRPQLHHRNGIVIVSGGSKSTASAVIDQHTLGCHGITRVGGCSRLCSKAGNDDDDDDDDDDELEDDLEDWMEALEDYQDTTPKLGIDIGAQLNPLTAEDASSIMAEATELINDAIAGRIDEVERVRTDLKKTAEKNKKTSDMVSELNARRESSKLASKIDKLAADFMASTKNVRDSTKLAAKADLAMEGTGKGIEMGTWGYVDGAAVTSSGAGGSLSSLLGSVDGSTSSSTTTAEDNDAATEQVQNRVIVVADTSSDEIAKLVVPIFSKKLEAAVPDIDIRVMKPTETMPLGGDNAKCMLIFCTSLSEKSSFDNLVERALRRTMLPGGKLSTPPTQLVGVSTVGTERLDKFPYNIDFFNKGKLEKRLRIEEAFVRTVNKRITSPALDYTVCKFGEFKKKGGDEPFQLMPGDVLDGATTPETAAEVLLQAVAYQPFARNATLCVVGSYNPAPQQQEQTARYWNEQFLLLDGPELFRMDDVQDSQLYEELVEYVQEWAEVLSDTGKGLTTPIAAIPSPSNNNKLNPELGGVTERFGLKLLFLPTRTGSNYMSKADDERIQQDQDKNSNTYSRSTMNRQSQINRNKIGKDGGIEIVVEIFASDMNSIEKKENLRVRLKRCNYPNNAPIKEISETTIVKRFEEAIKSWQKNN